MRLTLEPILIHKIMIEGLQRIPLRFWKSDSDREPVREWLNTLPLEDRRILGRDMAKVQFGWPIGLPLCRPLKDGLWELRSTLPSRREARILFGFHEGLLIALHGFIKKSRETPKHELKIARERLNEVTR